MTRVQACREDTSPIEVPGWTVEDWLKPLQFDALISEALLARLAASQAAGGGESATRSAPKKVPGAHQLAFVKRLASHGSAETIFSLLKETPVLSNHPVQRLKPKPPTTQWLQPWTYLGPAVACSE